MELKLTETKNVNDKVVELYEIARYTVKVVNHEWGYKSIAVKKGIGDYLPDIYCRDDIEGNVIAFEIQTTSYGSLETEEIKKMVAGLNEAVEVVEILTKEFVK